MFSLESNVRYFSSPFSRSATAVSIRPIPRCAASRPHSSPSNPRNRSRGISFFDYISDVLNKAATIPPGSPVEAYRNFLPDKWIKKEQGQ